MGYENVVYPGDIRLNLEVNKQKSHAECRAETDNDEPIIEMEKKLWY